VVYQARSGRVISLFKNVKEQVKIPFNADQLFFRISRCYFRKTEVLFRTNKGIQPIGKELVRMTKAEKNTILMMRKQNKSYKYIADVTGISINTVKSFVLTGA